MSDEQKDLKLTLEISDLANNFNHSVDLEHVSEEELKEMENKINQILQERGLKLNFDDWTVTGI